MKPVIKDVEKSAPLKKLESSTIVEIPLLSESISDAAKVELVDEILDRCISGKIVDGKAVFENEFSLTDTLVMKIEIAGEKAEAFQLRLFGILAT